MYRHGTARSGADIAKTAPATQRSKTPSIIGFSTPGAVDRRAYPRQRPRARPEPLFLLHFSYVPFHLEAGEPFHVAREGDIRSHALPFVAGGIPCPGLRISWRPLYCESSATCH